MRRPFDIYIQEVTSHSHELACAPTSMLQASRFVCFHFHLRFVATIDPGIPTQTLSPPSQDKQIPASRSQAQPDKREWPQPFTPKLQALDRGSSQLLSSPCDQPIDFRLPLGLILELLDSIMDVVTVGSREASRPSQFPASLRSNRLSMHGLYMLTVGWGGFSIYRLGLLLLLLDSTSPFKDMSFDPAKVLATAISRISGFY